MRYYVLSSIVQLDGIPLYPLDQLELGDLTNVPLDATLMTQLIVEFEVRLSARHLM